MSTTPNYASTPVVGAALLTAANTGTRSAPAGGSTVYTAGTTGGTIERIVANLHGSTTTPTSVLLYRVIAGAYFLYKELQINQITIVAGVSTPEQSLQASDYPNLFPIAMPANSTLYAVLSVAAANGISIQAEGGTY